MKRVATLCALMGSIMQAAKESGGLGAKPRRVTAVIKGDRGPAEIVAKLLGPSGLGKR